MVIKGQKTLQDNPTVPLGYHYSNPATSPMISNDFALWAKAELYILVPSLTNLLTFSLSLAESWKNLSILMYVCQSVGWLTSLLELDKYRDILSSC